MSIDIQVIQRINKRLEILLPQYKKAISEENFSFAESLMVDIQPLLKTVKKNSQLVELRNALYEVAINKNQYKYAIEGLLANRKLINKRTRLYLDSATLLAIAYL